MESWYARHLERVPGDTRSEDADPMAAELLYRSRTEGLDEEVQCEGHGETRGSINSTIINNNEDD